MLENPKPSMIQTWEPTQNVTGDSVTCHFRLLVLVLPVGDAGICRPKRSNILGSKHIYI